MMSIGDDFRFFKNSVNVDIYIGAGTGKKLLEDLNAAKHSIKVVSPYISASFIKRLIYLSEKGISVSLVASDDVVQYKSETLKCIKAALRQETHIIESGVKKKKRLSSYRIFLIVLICISLLVFFYAPYISFLVKCIPFLIIILFVINESKIKKTRIYNYSYRQIFPFKIYINPNKSALHFSNIFIHSKIYVIDDQIAYLGSMNLTANGMGNNIETRIRTTDKETVFGLSTFVDSLINNEEKNFIDLNTLGSKLFYEPPK